MVAKRFFYIILGIVCFFADQLQAVDLPVFYRAPLFQAFHDQQSDWTTQLNVRFAGGQSRRGWDGGEHKTSILNIYGPTHIAFLGQGLEDLDKKPETEKWWGTTDANNQGPFYTDLLEDNLKLLEDDDGKIKLFGKLKVYDCAFTVKQSIFSGFYIQAYVPIRRIKIEDIEAKNLGEETITVKEKSGGNIVDKTIVMDDFIKNDLPKVLKENNFVFEDFEKTIFKKTTVPDCMLSAGWQGKGSESLGIIDSIRGFIQAGVIIPTSGRKNEDDPFAISLGYNDFWGFNAQASAEVALWKIVLGGHAGVNVFLPSSREVRMKTDQRQTGWTMLGKGRAKVDKAAIWNLSGYVKAHQIVGGFSVLVGYTYLHEEDTDLLIKDDDFLSSVVAAGRAKETSSFISRENIVNSDQRFKNKNQQTFHFLAEYNARVHTDSWFAPMVRVEYSYPFFGKRSGGVDMLAGTLGIQIVWDM